MKHRVFPGSQWDVLLGNPEIGGGEPVGWGGWEFPASFSLTWKQLKKKKVPAAGYPINRISILTKLKYFFLFLSKYFSSFLKVFLAHMNYDWTLL